MKSDLLLRNRKNVGEISHLTLNRLAGPERIQIFTDLWFAHIDGTVVLSLHALRVDLQVQLPHARRHRLLDHVVKMNLRGQRDIIFSFLRYYTLLDI